MTEEIERWEREEGPDFLRKIGLEEGDKVLDFGAGHGHYTLPAAAVVKGAGTVYAVDKEEGPLHSIADKASEHGLRNVRTIKNSGGIELKFEENSIDRVLLFDILHYMEREDRRELYREARRILKPEGVLSVYPKHTKEDFPMGEFEDMSVEDVANEVQELGLELKDKIYGKIAHDEGLVEGCVLNFIK